MISTRLIIALLFTLLCTPPVQAEGNYYVGRDEGGIYFQTDNHGGWYIDRADLKNFRIWETGGGKYQIGSEKHGTYMLIDKPRKFYIDLEGRDQGEREVEQFKRKQENPAYKNETKVFVKGNQVLVPATLGSNSRETEALLVLDTGASITLLYQEIAAQLGYLKVGPYVKKDIYPGFIEFKGSAMAHHGLLGMNFCEALNIKLISKIRSLDGNNRDCRWKGMV